MELESSLTRIKTEELQQELLQERTLLGDS